jgi:iron complex outermembrane receptor protein
MEMSHKILITRLLAAFAVCGSLLHGEITFAQSAVAQVGAPTALEEIVVTAQKRSESIQEVPIAITAF